MLPRDEELLTYISVCENLIPHLEMMHNLFLYSFSCAATYLHFVFLYICIFFLTHSQIPSLLLCLRLIKVLKQPNVSSYHSESTHPVQLLQELMCL